MSALAERLRRARLANGMSYRKAADLVGVSQTMIKKYEEGSVPSSDILLNLAKAYHVHVEYFFRTPIQDLRNVKFRKQKNLGKKELASIKHWILDQVERRLEIENLFPNPLVQSFSFPKGLPSLIASMEEIEEIALHLRQEWDLGLAPITSFVDLLEEHGLRVFMVDVNHPGFDGLAGTLSDQIPIIVVGDSWTGDRQRFTLAHELGHLVLAGRLPPRIDEELASNRFAGALLMPKSTMVQEMGKKRSAVEIRELMLLKEEYGISMNALCYRLRDLLIISEPYFNQLKTLFKKNKWHIQEPGAPYPSEKVHVFKHRVLHALSEDIIGESKAAELLNMTIKEFRDYRTAAHEKPLTC